MIKASDVRYPQRTINVIDGKGTFRTADGETIKLTSLTRTTDAGDPRVCVEIIDDAFALPIRLYFADLGKDPELVGVEIGSEHQPQTPLKRAQIAHLGRQLPILTAFARAEINYFNDPAAVAPLLEVLNEVGTTRRGKPGRFYKVIGAEYSTRVREGDPAPITSLAEAHGVNKSSASRWVKQAKIRGYVDEGGS